MGGSALPAELPEMFGAEGVLFRRCADETAQRELPALVAVFKDYFVRHGQVVYENPSPGNKAGMLVQGDSWDDAVEAMLDRVMATASGLATCSKKLGYRELAIWKDGVTL